MLSKLSLVRFPLLLVVFAAVVLYSRVLFCTRIDPEICFHAQFYRNKVAWSQKLTREQGSKIVIYGGSSCAFSVQGARMLEKHGLPLVNMGLGAQHGPALLTQSALAEIRHGDTLLVGIEPVLLINPHKILPTACKLGLAIDHPKWIHLPWEISWFSPLEAALHCTTGLKWFLLLPDSICPPNKKPRWGYTLADTDPTGWQTLRQYDKNRPLENWGLIPPDYKYLSEDNRALLKWIAQWCMQNQVRVAYSLPLGHKEPEDAQQLMKSNLSLVKEISAIMPVLKDPRMGVLCGRAHFIDSEYHPDGETSALHTDELAQQIKNWEIWTQGELEAWEKQNLK